MIAASERPARAAAVANPARSECPAKSPSSPAAAARTATISARVRSDKVGPRCPCRTIRRKTRASLTTAVSCQRRSARTGQVASSPPNETATLANRPDALAANGDDIHSAARKLLAALAQHAPARFTWGQAATLAGLKPSGGHFNAGRKALRDAGYIEETVDLVSVSAAGLEAAGEVPPAPSTAAERLAMWCGRPPSPAPDMLRTLAAKGEQFTETDDLAATLGKKPSDRHWNSGIAVLRNNGLIEVDGRSSLRSFFCKVRFLSDHYKVASICTRRPGFDGQR
jgi:hypothetical protein